MSIWKENLAIYQKSIRAFFQAPFHLKCVGNYYPSMVAKLGIKKDSNFKKNLLRRKMTCLLQFSLIGP